MVANENMDIRTAKELAIDENQDWKKEQSWFLFDDGSAIMYEPGKGGIVSIISTAAEFAAAAAATSAAVFDQ